jgi:hypothetical protein
MRVETVERDGNALCWGGRVYSMYSGRMFDFMGTVGTARKFSGNQQGFSLECGRWRKKKGGGNRKVHDEEESHGTHRLEGVVVRGRQSPIYIDSIEIYERQQTNDFWFALTSSSNM